MAPKKSTPNMDPVWDHCTRIDNHRMHLKCKHCGLERWGGIIRMKHHLAGTHENVIPCTQCPKDVRKICLELLQKSSTPKPLTVIDNSEVIGKPNDVSVDGKGKSAIVAYTNKERGKGVKQLSENAMMKNREPVIQSICRFLYGNALPFDLVKSPLFVSMLEKVGEYGKGLEPPTYHEASVTFFKKEVESVNLMLEKYKREWKKSGCTLMCDGWTDKKSRSLTNFLVNSPSGTVFIKSIDTSNVIKDSHNLFELLDSMVEEIGEENVVQVVTDSSSAYVEAGELLMGKRKKLFWSPCAAHCIYKILEDICDIPIFKSTIEKANEACTFIYRHSWVLSLFRMFSNKRDLKRVGVTRFATSFLTLSSFSENNLSLRAMFTSEEWATSQYASKPEAIKVAEILVRDDKFWKSIKYCMKCVGPLVKVLRLVDSDVKPTMGYIYEAMDRAKEQISQNFNHNKGQYKQIWNAIDQRWLQLHTPLHAAAYFLNPKFQYNDSFSADKEVKIGLYTTIERIYPETETRILIDGQLEKFKKSEGLFGINMANLTRYKKQPALWWESFGDECKELQNLAVKVLSLTCSATGCERNWSAFKHFHFKKRNHLQQQRLSDLIFVMYNIQLDLRQSNRQAKGDTYDPICLSDMESDDEWITEKEQPCLPLDNSWMDTNECFDDNEVVETSNKRKRGARGLNHGRKDKEHTFKDDEIEDSTLDTIEEIVIKKEMESSIIEEEEEESDDRTVDDEYICVKRSS